MKQPPSIAECHRAPITKSVFQISPKRWAIGRELECELLGQRPADDVVAAWKDGDDSFVLRKKTAQEVESTSGITASDEVQLVHALGTKSAVWSIGKLAFCKVKSWHDGFESEAQTIAFVKENFPQIPVPEVIYEYIDGGRSFLILKRVPGRTLRDAWVDLPPSSHDNILKTIVEFCVIMAAKTSPHLQSVTGKALLEPYLSPSNKTGLLGPLTIEEGISFFCPTPTDPAPKLEAFCFYHADLGPGNIIISPTGEVSGVIDWELAGFYPDFWISTKPSVSPGLDFYPSVPGFEDTEWRRRLRVALGEKGFTLAASWFMTWKNIIRPRSGKEES